MKLKRLEKACQNISDSFRAAIKDIEGSAQAVFEIAKAENALVDVANHDFVFVFRPVAQELSELTGNRYVDFLDQARELILEGKDIPDVLWHFDLMLYDLKHGRK